MKSKLLMLLVTILSVYSLSAQTTVGVQKFGAYDGQPDTVDVGTLQIHLRIPVYQRAGRGRDTTISFTLNDSVPWPVPWVVGPGGVAYNFHPGLGLSIGGAAGTLTNVQVTHQCQAIAGSGSYTDYTWTYVDALGNSHLFPGTSRTVSDSNNTCSSLNITSFGLSAQASDGSGYLINIPSSGFSPATVTSPSGTVYSPSTKELIASLRDSNGNSIGLGSPSAGATCAIFLPCMDNRGNIISYTVQDTVNSSIQLSGGGYNADFTARNPLVVTYLDDTGTQQNVTFSYRMYRFNYSGSVPEGFLDNISFPDGSTYRFNYMTDSTGALIYGGSNPAILTGITLPSEGVISYGYPGGFTSCGSNPTYIPSLTRTTADGTTTYTRTITSEATTSPAHCSISKSYTTLSKPNGDQTTVYFIVPQHYAECPSCGLGSKPAIGWFPDSKFFETTRYEYSHQNLSTPIRTTRRCYNGATGDCTATGVNEPVTQLAVTTTLENGLSSQVVTQYTGNGLPTEVDEYDFGATSPTRKTVTAYASLGNNISDRLSSVIIYDSAGNIAKKTTYTYDEVTPPPLTLPGHSTISGSRGNATSVTDLVDSSGATRVTKYGFDDAGQVTSITDPNINQTTYDYDPTTDTCRTKITRPTTGNVKHISTFACGPNSGLVTSASDENGNPTSYGYDSMFRPKSVNYPDGGQTTYDYTPTSVTTKILQAAGIWMTAVKEFDGYGRPAHDGGFDGSRVDYTYDSSGQLQTVSNPHFATAGSTDGVTTYQYDALGRATQTAPPDGTVPGPDSACLANNICEQYSGNVTTVTDQAGKQRRSTRDALGRLIEVDEPGDAFPGTPAQANIDIGEIKTASTAKQATGSLTITGYEGSVTSDPCASSTSDAGFTLGTGGDTGGGGSTCPQTFYDSGTVTIAVNGHPDQTSYQQGSDDTTVASGLASAINADANAYVTATSSAATLYLKAKQAGSAGNYSWSLSSKSTDTTGNFGPAGSFSSSPTSGTLTGGTDGTTVTDHGSVTMSVGTFTTASVPYGPGTVNTTGAKVAAALANALAGSGFTGGTNGGTVITVTDNSVGVAGNGISVAIYPTSSDPTDFPSPSFSVPSTALANGQNPAPSGLAQPFVTLYSYDALSNLTCVEQHGDATTGTGCSAPPSSDPTSPWRVRRFSYDLLSRLLTAQNPESGKTTYAYDANGNVVTKTDARGITINYSPSDSPIDALNRVTKKTYSNGEPPVTFNYDVLPSAIKAPGTLANTVDRLVSSSVGNTATIQTYDTMGRIYTQWQCTPLNCGTGWFQQDYRYDLAGELTLHGFNSAFSIGQSYDGSGRLAQVTSSVSDAQHPGTLATVDPSAGYYPNGAIRKWTLGNGLTETSAYNSRLQPCRRNVNSSGSVLALCSDALPAGNVLDFTYGFNAGSSNNGNLASFSATGAQTFNRTYTYDALNRLATMSAPGDTCSGLAWQYDAWGNRSSQNITGGSCFPFQASANAQNQLTGYQYDSAGNMISDGTHTYGYDAEGRLSQVDGGNTATYVYDAAGQRVQKNTPSAQTNYWLDLDGNTSVEWNQNSGWMVDYIYANGNLLAQYKAGTTFFVHRDHLGSTRLITALNKTPSDSLDYLPYGEQIAGATGTTHKFTGKERDSESGLDNFDFRYYSSSLGRFVRPDESFAGWDQAYPQTFNLYSYVRNSPTVNVDPDGHDCVYLSDTGTAVESVDKDSNVKECSHNGGYWVNGDVQQVHLFTNSNDVFLQGSQGGTLTFAAYRKIIPGTLDAEVNSAVFGVPNLSGNVDLYKLYVDSNGPQVVPRDPFDLRVECALNAAGHTAYEASPLGLVNDIADALATGSLKPITGADKIELAGKAAEEASKNPAAQSAVRSVSKALGSSMSMRSAGKMLGNFGRFAGYAAIAIHLSNGVSEYRECTQ